MSTVKIEYPVWVWNTSPETAIKADEAIFDPASQRYEVKGKQGEAVYYANCSVDYPAFHIVCHEVMELEKKIIEKKKLLSGSQVEMLNVIVDREIFLDTLDK